MKKLITIATCILMLSIFTVTAFAAPGLTLNADKTTAYASDTVTVTASITMNNCTIGGIEVTYDSKVLSLTSGECNLSSADIKYFDPSSGDGGFAYSSATKVSGKAFTFVFKVADTAALGKTNITVKFTSGSDSATQTFAITVACKHKYDNDCDTTCNLCNEKREANHAWNSGKVTKEATCSAAGTKVLTCTSCKTTKETTIEKKGHSYENACDSKCNVCGNERGSGHSWKMYYGDGYHWETCTTCNQVRNREEHKPEDEYVTTSKVHGHKCTVCGARAQEEKHDFENDCDTDCTICGYTRTIEHSYKRQLSFDESGHWYECESCQEKLEIIPHTPGPEATEETDQTCTECGYIIQAAQKHEHSMAGDWLNNEGSHWYVCACGEEILPELHNFGLGVTNKEQGVIIYTCSECAHTKTEPYIPDESDESNSDLSVSISTETSENESSDTDENSESNIPWNILTFVCAGVALISIIINIVLATRLSNKDYERDFVDDIDDLM